MSIICVGSVNIDDVYKVEHIARKGETISSTSFEQLPGGKGANQSVAIAKAGGKVYHVGAVGKDGIWVKELMHSSGVNVDNLTVTATSTGKAIIQVSQEEGDNAIVLYPGANDEVSSDQVSDSINAIPQAKWLLCQGELPSKITAAAMYQAKSRGIMVCFNPAPMSPTLTKDFDLALIDLLVVNELEFREISNLLNLAPSDSHVQDIADLMANLPTLSICVLTLGSKGGILGMKSSKSPTEVYPGIVNTQGFKVGEVIDTTGAGDTFVGFFLARIVVHDLKTVDLGTIEEIFALSNIAAAHSCTKKGAMQSIPTIEEVMDFFNNFA